MNIIVLISADAEWRAVKEILTPNEIHSSPLGEWFETTFNSSTSLRINLQPVTFYHGGWGKISSAATAQYVIDRWSPDLLVNLGTCGGFEGRVARGTVILVEKTIVYDILEQMTDPDQAILHYVIEIDLSWLGKCVQSSVISNQFSLVRGPLVSADRDIVASDIPMLVKKYDAIAADWESGAIAWVAKQNGVRCLILRGVTDLVSAGGGEAYGDYDLFLRRTQEIMRQLILLITDHECAWIVPSSSLQPKRQRRPSRARRSSASAGPQLPDG
ncbi:MAG: 5'-methylthioadenosine/S-adenosylhomocysteine nucleosidase [Anaerolineales bacterium]|jgi:adenosylhomocysteine nucleosidase|nr:5'-methylthioadenosine/S-adenosylhomocysteine nucleosidase [Anaerolineales bacterium]